MIKYMTACATMLMISIALPGAGGAQPVVRPTQAPKRAVATRAAPTDHVNIEKGGFVALLFMHNDPIATDVCNHVDGYFDFSAEGADLQHDRFIYFASKREIKKKPLPCKDLPGYYNPQIWDDYNEYLRITDRGNGPFLFIVYKQQDGTPVNCGYIDFSKVEPRYWDNAIVNLAVYYKKGPSAWIRERQLWVADDNNPLSEIGNGFKNLMGLGPARCANG